MSGDLVTRLKETEGTQRQDYVLVEQTLARLEAPMQQMIQTAAIPHWFTRAFLAALQGLEALPEALFQEITALSFVEGFSDLGFSVHERFRKPMLEEFYRRDKDGFIECSRRALAFCQKHDQRRSVWRIETLYHHLTADPKEGCTLFVQQVDEWKQEGRDDKVEMLARAGIEVVESSRVPMDVAERLEYIHASLGLVYGRRESGGATPENDQKIAARFLAGDGAAVATMDSWIARAAWPYQRRLGYRWEDVLQDARVEITRLLQRREFRGGTSLRTYLWRVVQHMCLEQIRGQSKWQWSELATESRDPDSVMGRYINQETENREAVEETRGLLLNVWNRMPSDCRELWGMIAAGLTYAEMAQRKGVAEGTLRVRVLRCREKAALLREELRTVRRKEREAAKGESSGERASS